MLVSFILSFYFFFLFLFQRTLFPSFFQTLSPLVARSTSGANFEILFRTLACFSLEREEATMPKGSEHKNESAHAVSSSGNERGKSRRKKI